MRRCILHIGHAKTATSYLQHCLHLNEPLLAARNWFLPSNFGPVGSYDLAELSRNGDVHSGNLAPMHELLSVGPGDAVPAMRALLFNNPAMPAGSNLLLSSELFFYYPNATADVIRGARAHGFAPEVIAYVARQDRSAIPSYLQYVRNHGYTSGIADFLLHDTHMQYCRYRRAMQRLSVAAPGTPITLRTFDRAFLTEGDIFTDFMRAIGSPLLGDAPVRPRAGGNEGLLLEQYELLRAAALLDRPDAAQRLRRSLGPPTQEQRARVQAFYYRPYVQSFIANHFMQTNADLLDRYLPHAGPAERAYWREPDEPLPLVAVDASLLGRLREEAFG